MRIRLFFIGIFAVSCAAAAQILTWEPVYITEEDSVTIIYDATQGSAGLQGYTGDVYAHTGVILTTSVGPWDWKHVKTNWGQNTSETKLERIGSDLYRFKIKPSIKEYYGILPTEKVLELAFVFRSAHSPYKEGKTEGGGDIFLPLRSGITIQTPSEEMLFVNLNDTISVLAFAAPGTEWLKLYVNQDLIFQTENDSLYYRFIADEYGKKYVKIVAENEFGFLAADSFYYVVNTPLVTQVLPEGVVDGINYLNSTTATLCLFAPNKRFVYIIGDFNNWEVDPAYYLKRVPEGNRFWLTISNLEPKKEYLFQYLVDGSLRIADPYAEKISDPWNDQWISDDTYPNLISYPFGKTTEIASVLQTAQEPYQWEVTDFNRPKPEDLLIYELLVRDFIAQHDYKTLIDTLGYFEKLGINAIELMPINEFEGNECWGYNPAFYFAPDKYYGPKKYLKKFIDECHKRGIAVILDMVLNHSFGQSPLVRLYNQGDYGPPTSENPWYNVTATHPYSVGYDFNHESSATQTFVDRVNAFWLTEYGIDGYRFDLSKGFTQKYSDNDVGLWSAYDASRIAILKRMTDKIRSVDSSAYVILEHFADNEEEKELAEYGMMLWGNMNAAYSQSAMGWLEDSQRSSDLSWGFFKTRGWSKPYLVTYMESHDEPWLMYKNLRWGRSHEGYDIQNLSTALDRVKLVAAFFFTLPGPKMMWQFGELGYDQYLPESGPERTAPKPILWEYYHQPERKNLYDSIAALIKLRREHKVFRDPQSNVQMRVGQGQYDRRINISNDSMNVTIIGNFAVTTKSVNPNFQKTGEWYDYFFGDTILVVDVHEPISLAPGEFHIYSDVKLETPDIATGLNGNSGMDLRIFELKQNHPNPFNPQTSIQYNLAHTGDVNLNVYNIVGQKVRTLVNDAQAFGEHKVIWNGMSDDGRLTAGGLYFYRLQAGDFVQTRKMLLIK